MVKKEILDILEGITDICRDMAYKLYRKSDCEDVEFNIYSESLEKISDKISKLKENIK